MFATTTRYFPLIEGVSRSSYVSRPFVNMRSYVAPGGAVGSATKLLPYTFSLTGKRLLRNYTSSTEINNNSMGTLFVGHHFKKGFELIPLILLCEHDILFRQLIFCYKIVGYFMIDGKKAYAFSQPMSWSSISGHRYRLHEEGIGLWRSLAYSYTQQWTIINLIIMIKVSWTKTSKCISRTLEFLRYLYTYILCLVL